MSPNENTEFIKEKKVPSKRHEFSFYRGYSDYNSFPIAEYDYYAILASLGKYNPDALPTADKVLTHDIPTTTALHFYDKSKQKTPIDARVDTVTPNLSEIADDYKRAELYNIQDFESAAVDRIKEKTHRILSDPIRKYQSQMVIDTRNLKSRVIKDKTMPIAEKLMHFSVMNLNINTLLLERITDVLDYQEKIYTFEKQEKKALGKNFYVEMTLTDGAEATKIDFRDSSNNMNIPSGAEIKDDPKHNLKNLTIYFDSGTNVHFSTNKPANSLETTVKLSNAPMAYTMDLQDFSIESVNIRASGANASVRIIGLY